MSLTVKINQIVLLNISDHYVRNKVQIKPKSTRIVGALLGKQESRKVSVLLTTELLFQLDDKEEITSIDVAYLKNKITLIATVYPEYEFLGWYSTCSEKHLNPSQTDLKFHKILSEINENPIFLMMNPNKNMKIANELAIQTFELKIDMSSKGKGNACESFSEINFEIEVDKSETITIDHVLKDFTQTETSQLGDSLSSMLNSIKMYEKKLINLHNSIEKNQKMKDDKKLMRELKELLNSFPVKDSDIIDKKIFEEGLEASILTMLSSVICFNKTASEVISIKNDFEPCFRKSNTDFS